MKVLHIIGGGDVGGAKVHVLTLVKELEKSIDVKIISLRPGPFSDDAVKMGIDITVIRSGNILKDIKTVIKIVRKEKFDIIHSHGAKANMFSIMVKKAVNIASVTTVHSDYKLDYMHSFIKRITFGTINKIALRKIDYYVTVSNCFKDMLKERGFAPDRIYTVYNGMDFEKELPVYAKESFIDKYKLNISKDDIIVGLAARLSPVKNLETLIVAAQLTFKKNKKIKYIIGGDGEDMRKLTAKVKSLGLADTVFFTGWLDNPYELISCIDISVLTSISETFSYSVLEGVMFKKAIISTNVGGIPDLVEDNKNGFLFSPGDYEKLAEHILFLAKSPDTRKIFGERINKKAAAHFSLKTMGLTQHKIYENILSSKTNDNEKYSYDAVISGYYGFQNLGDDALLMSIINNLKFFDNNIRILILSKSPYETKHLHKVDSINRINIFKVIKYMKNSRLFMFGGGTLIQESTSTRSLIYYLGMMWLAKKMKLKTMLYANGVEPIEKYINKKFTKKMLNKVDVITLRENNSKKELINLGITVPETYVTADPAVTCIPSDNARINKILANEGIPQNLSYAGFSIREWLGYEKKLIPAIAYFADWLYENYNLTPIFIPMQKQYIDDVKISQKAAGLIKNPSYVIKSDLSVGDVLGLISRMDMITGMRLHALIFAASLGIPFIGIAYEPKVDWFLEYIGKSSLLAGNVKDITYDKLKNKASIVLKNKNDISNGLIIKTKELKNKAVEDAKIAIELINKKS